MQHLLQAAVGNHMAEHRAHPLEVGNELRPDGHPDDVLLCRNRLDARRRLLGLARRYCRPGSKISFSRRCRRIEQVEVPCWLALGRRPRRRPSLRQAAHEIRDRWPRRQGSDQSPDLVLGAPGGAVEDLAEPFVAKDVTKDDERGEAKATVAQVISQDREPHQQARGRESTKGRAAAESQVPDTKFETRGKTKVDGELAAVELAEIGEELDEELAFIGTELIQAAGELGGREAREGRHASLYPTISVSRGRLQAARSASFSTEAGAPARAPNARARASD